MNESAFKSVFNSASSSPQWTSARFRIEKIFKICFNRKKKFNFLKTGYYRVLKNGVEINKNLGSQIVTVTSSNLVVLCMTKRILLYSFNFYGFAFPDKKK